MAAEEHLLAHGRKRLGRKLPGPAGLLDLRDRRRISGAGRPILRQSPSAGRLSGHGAGLPDGRHRRSRGQLAGGHGFAIFSSDILYTLAVGRLPGIVSILFAGILLSNVRGLLASEWRPAREDEDRLRALTKLLDKLVDQWPAKAWPVLEVPFFALAALLLLLSLAGVGTRFGTA